MGPNVFDEIELFAGICRQPDHLDPLSETSNLSQRALRGVGRSIIQHEKDPLARATRPSREKLQEADRLCGDRVLPQSVCEEKGSVRIAEGSADANPMIL